MKHSSRFTFLLLPKITAVCLYLFICAAAPAAFSAPAEGILKPVAEVASAKVNINTASADELSAKLNGVGKAKAQAIVDFRNTHGAFRHIDELTEVKGIGEAILEKNKDRIVL